VAYHIHNASDREEETVPDDASHPRLKVEPLEVSIGLRKQACDAIKRAITEMDLYGHAGEIRLDERQLSQDLGVSRTPIREALSVLEQEGFVRTVPRRGVVVVRKTKREVVEMITVWAALESMAARLAAPRIAAAEVAELRALVDAFDDDPSSHISEYSHANMEFHKAIIRMGGIGLMASLTETLFVHMRAVRAVTMTQDNRAQRSIVDHRNIIAALAAHDADRAEHLVRDHTMGLAAHVEKFGDFLDETSPALRERSMLRSSEGEGAAHRTMPLAAQDGSVPRATRSTASLRSTTSPA
jgi:DNA-binding GntR family transcriptional regulator